MLLLSSEAASPKTLFNSLFAPAPAPSRSSMPPAPRGSPRAAREVTQLLGPGHQHSLAEEMGGKKKKKKRRDACFIKKEQGEGKGRRRGGRTGALVLGAGGKPSHVPGEQCLAARERNCSEQGGLQPAAFPPCPPPETLVPRNQTFLQALPKRNSSTEKASFVKSRSKCLCTRISSFLPFFFFSYVLSAIV